MKATLTKEQQKVLVSLANEYVKQSDNKLSRKAREWRRSEQMMQMYMPEAEAERKLKEDTEDKSFTKLTIPYAYAMTMAQHTYLCSVFLARNPIFQFQGRNGTGQNSVMAMESVVDYQVENGEIAVPLYIALYDLLLYGVSAVFLTWEEQRSYITAYSMVPSVVDGITVMQGDEPVLEEVEEVIDVKGYKGSKAFNVKPKDLIVDPSVGFINYQQGRFLGRRYQMSIEELKDIAKDRDYINIEQLQASGGRQNDVDGDNPALLETDAPGDSSIVTKPEAGFVNMIDLYVKLAPKEYGLGKNDRNEVWVLTIADGCLLIDAVPSGWVHGKFPGTLGTLEYDGYTLSSRGTPEVARPLNNTMDWLINSHMFNVEKAVNNEFIFDPSMINTRDFLDPRPGKRIRMRPEAYGKDPRNSVHQFNQYDLTQTNMQDIAFVEALFQRVFGINEQMLGALSSGGRKTATEVRSAVGLGLNRLKVLSEFLGKQFFSPLAMMLVSNSRQMYSTEDKFQIAENKDSQEYREFTLDDIQGQFDFAPVDGSIPIDRLAQVAMLKEALMAVSQLPAIAGRYDVAKFFEHIMQVSGIKNMSSFEITDPNQVAKESALGMLATGGVNVDRAGNTGAGEGAAGVNGAPQVSGVGTVG